MADVPSHSDRATPLVFVTAPMTRLTAKERSHMSFLARTIGSSIDEATREAEDPWLVRVYVPFEHSAPWLDGKTPAEVFSTIEGLFNHHVDAVIMLGHDGGSFGCGQELAWACVRGLPLLFLHHADEPVSRQVLGAATRHPIAIAEYRDARGLESKVHSFMTEHRLWLMSAHQRRAERAAALTPMAEAFRAGWKQLSENERDDVSDRIRIPRARLGELIKDPLRLAWTSHDEMRRLDRALHRDASAQAAAEPLVMPEELDVLEDTAEDAEWSNAEILGTLAFVCEQRAGDAIRRLPLDSPELWERMRNAWARQR